jgi:predicted DNA-binding transcriptional regulator YafY
MPKKLSPTQISKLVSLRQGESKVTVSNLAIRFGVSERTVYYYLAEWRRCEQHVAISVAMTAEDDDV